MEEYSQSRGARAAGRRARLAAKDVAGVGNRLGITRGILYCTVKIRWSAYA
jgi:hypothetical protein